MKKVLLFFSIFFSATLIANAAPCKIIKGEGTHIGDEIQCGTENFYVLSNDGEEIKMLSKYNLYVGGAYHKIEFEQSFETWNEAYQFYQNNYAEDYDGYARFIVNENNEYYGAIAYKHLEYNEVKQDESAIGAHGNLKVEPLFPEVGVYNYELSGKNNDSDFVWDYLYNEEIRSEIYNKGYIDISIDFKEEHNNNDPSIFIQYLLNYEETLNEYDLDVKDMNILSVSDINNIVIEVSGKELPLSEWWENEEDWGIVTLNGYEVYNRIGSIKNYLPEEYNWLWSTTYWTRTKPANTEDELRLFFIDTEGDLCDASYCEVSVGAGIRPVITISASDIIYKVKTKTDGNGTVEADHIEAENGTEVKFTVMPKDGFELKEVKVTDSNGNVITFTENTFTMPNANVTIEATFVKIEKNPNTLTFVGYLIIGILFVSAIGTIAYSDKMKEFNR